MTATPTLRLLRSVDFERTLRAPVRVRTAHFALHHLRGQPALREHSPLSPPEAKLYTGPAPKRPESVDNISASVWLGMVVPKRLARRAVTRNLVKRCIRAAFAAACASPALPSGLIVVRLRNPIDPRQFPSAASAALRALLRDELWQLRHQAASKLMVLGEGGHAAASHAAPTLGPDPALGTIAAPSLPPAALVRSGPHGGPCPAA